MNRKRYSAIQSLVQQITSTRPVAWFFARTLHHLDRPLLRLTGNRFCLTSFFSGLPVITLTTLGARSGKPRTLPLVAVSDEQDANIFALIASNFGQHHHPGWYHNLKACPRAICSIRGRTAEYIAHEATGQEYEKFWQLAMATYIGYAYYKQRTGGRHIPIMVMQLLETNSTEKHRTKNFLRNSV